MSQLSQRVSSNIVVVSVLVLWFLLVLIASLLGVFKGNPSQPPLLLGIAVVLPVLLFVLVWITSARFQRFVESLDIRAALTLPQTSRIIGVVFLTSYAYGVLPGIFALPAGIGDVAIGLTAPFIVWMLVSKTRARLAVLAVWNVLGLLDLVMAVSLGILTSRSSLGVLAGATTSALVVTFPLSLIPTFLVPFYFILHLITLDQARRQWGQRGQQRLMSEGIA